MTSPARSTVWGNRHKLLGPPGYLCSACETRTAVLDSRQTVEGFISRRRVCPACGTTAFTLEVPEDLLQTDAALQRRRYKSWKQLLYRYDVCERWGDFDTFVADTGPQPPNQVLLRLDPAQPYSPTNFCWSPPGPVRKYVIVDGHTVPLTVALKTINVSRRVFEYRQKTLDQTRQQTFDYYRALQAKEST